MPFNFPQLRDVAELETTLQLARATALEGIIAEWMRVQWPVRGVALLAGRAQALDR